MINTKELTLMILHLISDFHKAGKAFDLLCGLEVSRR